MQWNKLSFEERKNILWAITVSFAEEIGNKLLTGEHNFDRDTLVISNGELTKQAVVIRRREDDVPQDMGEESVGIPVEVNIVIGVHAHKFADGSGEILVISGVSAEGEKSSYYYSIDRTEEGNMRAAGEMQLSPTGLDVGSVYSQLLGPFLYGRGLATQEMAKHRPRSSDLRGMVRALGMPKDSFWLQIKK